MILASRNLDTPIGRLFVAATNDGVCRVALPPESRASIRKELVRRYGKVTWRNSSDLLDRATRELDDYFSGRRKHFTLPIILEGSPFHLRVWKNLGRIPFGQTWSYAKLARSAGNPKAARASGTACGKNPLPIILPCHRVVGSDGSLGGFGGGLRMKRWLLEHEGATLSNF